MQVSTPRRCTGDEREVEIACEEHAREEHSRARLRIGLPKGSLQETRSLLVRGLARSCSRPLDYPAIDDPELECILIRAQEMGAT